MAAPISAGSGARTLYNLALAASLLLSCPAWIPWVLLSGKRRTSFLDRLGLREDRIPGSTGKERIWVHAVSVGETLSAAPLVRQLRRRLPGTGIILSTVTVTGQNVAARTLGDEVDGVFYFPFDLPGICGKFLDRVRPDLVAILETELWPNFLAECAKRGIPAVIVNGRISERSYRGYRRFGFLFSRVLAGLSAVAVQTAEDARRYKELGAGPGAVTVTGNMKYDVTPPDRLSELHAWMDGWKRRGTRWFVAGSTHDGEDGPVLRAFARARGAAPGVRLLLAPRHPERCDDVERLFRNDGWPVARWTRLQRKEEEAADAPVVLLDTVGELLSAYAAADLAFVGGSLVPKGGHNILEPALFGVPTVVGPRMENFREMAELFLDAGALVQVPDATSLAERVERWTACPSEAGETGRRARELLDAFRGATGRNAEVIERLLARRREGR